MAKYKIMIGNQQYQIKMSDSNKYILNHEIKYDYIHLTFNPDYQTIHVSIINPSQHTQYLLSQQRLGIYICKHLCATNGHIHQSYKYAGISGYIKEKTDSGVIHYRKKQPTRILKYPKWSRVGDHPILLTSLETNIDLETDIWNNGGTLNLHDAPEYTRGSHIRIKAGLCSCGINYVMHSAANRIYSMRSNIITLRPYSKNYDNYYVPATIDVTYTNLDTTNYTCDIHINQITGWFEKAYRQGLLGVAIKTYGPTWGLRARGWGTGCWNRRGLPKRASLYKCLDDIGSRDRGHKKHSSYQTLDHFDFYYEWTRKDIHPTYTFGSLSTNHGEPVYIEGVYSIVIFYKPTGTVLKHVVDNIPYIYRD